MQDAPQAAERSAVRFGDTEAAMTPLREAEVELNDRIGIIEQNVGVLVARISSILTPGEDTPSSDGVVQHTPRRMGSDLCGTLRNWSDRLDVANVILRDAISRVDV